MPKTAMIRARVEPRLKDLAEATLEQLGLSATTAITLFYRQIVERHGLPFAVHIPNAATQRAIQDARLGRGLIVAESLPDLYMKLDAPKQRLRRGAKRRARSRG